MSAMKFSEVIKMHLVLALVVVIGPCVTQEANQIFFPGSSAVFEVAAEPLLAAEHEMDPNTLKTAEDFANFYDLQLPPPKIATRNRATQTELDLPQAGCTPEKVSVPLDLPNERGMTYFPTCVHVNRCGGCCFLPYHTCQPLKTEILTVKAVKVNEGAVSSGRGRRRVRRQADYIPVEVEQHVTCGCDCKLKEADCNPAIQKYNQFQCACVCTNKDDQTTCFESSEHFWDNDNCKCRCRAARACSTGLIFNDASCSCERK